ncbi:hypothetical protein E3Q24_04060 [Wallemia mellicola]|nr:hypothetical protein E3Q24_04060 [Wallemia mellicola]
MKRDDDFRNLLMEFSGTLRILSEIIDILQFKNKINSLIALISLNLVIQFINWVEILSAIVISLLLLHYSKSTDKSPHKSIKTDKDINQAVIHLERINISVKQFNITKYPNKLLLSTLVVVIALRLLLDRRTFYSSLLTFLILMNSPEVYVIIDSLKASSDLKDNKPAILTTIKQKISTLKHNSKNKESYYRFEIYENQRWWMGLDWTHALLPGERPTWYVYCFLASDSGLNATLPPTTFELPERTSTDDKVVYTWTWLDETWVVATPGQSKPYKQITLPDISDKQDDKETAHNFSVDRSGAEKALKQGLAKFNRHSVQIGDQSKSNKDAKEGEKEVHRRTSVDGVSTQENNLVDGVDDQGWSYGDNQWERWTSKNGMGCYTRRRKWMRTAILKQTIIE